MRMICVRLRLNHPPPALSACDARTVSTIAAKTPRAMRAYVIVTPLGGGFGAGHFWSWGPLGMGLVCHKLAGSPMPDLVAIIQATSCIR